MRFLSNQTLRRAYRRNISKPLDEQRRTMLEFASEEIVVPRGKYKGMPYNPRRKPASELWFREIDSRRWQIHNYTGPTQSGKTLDAFIIPILYCLFEKEEDVIVGIPQMKMAMSKWIKDILPVLNRTQYKKYLPTKGRGSKGGEFNEVAFGNGCYLTFMSFGGDDKNRAGDTAPNLIVTETDGANEVSENSDEGTKIQQLIGRTLSYDLDAFIVMECTVTTDVGITWQTHTNGSESKIVRPCPYCGQKVTPEREHFIGWNDQADEISAGSNAGFACPKCSKLWTDKQRFEANKQSELIHRGQVIGTDGNVEGEIPRTSTLGFRVSAIDNFLRSSEYLGRLMWKAERDEDKDAADRTIKQQQFAEPVSNSFDELAPLKLYDTATRIVFGDGGTQQSQIPAGATVVTVGTDLRNTQLHWVAIAWEPDATARVIDYGIYNVPTRKYGFEIAVRWALCRMRDDVFSQGFMTVDGTRKLIDQWWIDVGYQPDPIYKFIKQTKTDSAWKKHVYPYLGRGVGPQYKGNYTHPEKEGKTVLRIIERAHKRYNVKQRCPYWMVDADHYKVFVHNRFRIPVYVHDIDDRGNLIEIDDHTTARLNRGAMSLFIPKSGDHLEYVRHILAERERTEFVPDKGPVTRMVTISQANHFLDATYVASAAAVDCGITTSPRVITQTAARPNTQPAHLDQFSSGEIIMPDGRVF